MPRLLPAASALLVSAAMVHAGQAQAPPGSPATNGAPRPAASASTATRPTPVARTQANPRRRSIVHHYPYPYPSYYNDDQSAGWRNPGGVGRYREYYPPGGQFERDLSARDPVRVATFGGGGIPDRQEQLQAQQIGIQRSNSIMQHIDNYARPYYGYGLGVGYFGGFN